MSLTTVNVGIIDVDKLEETKSTDIKRRAFEEDKVFAERVWDTLCRNSTDRLGLIRVGTVYFLRVSVAGSAATMKRCQSLETAEEEILRLLDQGEDMANA